MSDNQRDLNILRRAPVYITGNAWIPSTRTLPLMQYTVAEYTVKPTKLKAVQKALGDFVGQVRRYEPRTLYLVFSDDLKCSFVHVMAFESVAAERKHSQSRYVERFAHLVSPHCVGKPVFSEM